MGRSIKFHCAFVAGALLTAPAGLAAQGVPMVAHSTAEEYVSPVTANAANIRRLNIMLMVTSLRCRQTAHDFQSEYDLFAQAHQQNLEEAHEALSREMAAEHGEAGINRALDRIGVAIANRYGDGHPTLGCSDLKEATLMLAMSQDRLRLSQMADDLLGREPPPAASPEGSEAAPEPRPEIRPPYVPGAQIPHFGRG